MAKQTFTVGQVLTAAQMTSLQQTAMGGGSATAKTASYTLVAADAGTTVIMNSASATTITVNTALFAAGDTVFIINQGAGVCTVTAGTATVNTASSLALSQYETGQLYFLSTSAAVFSEYQQAAASGGMTQLGSTTTLSGASTTVSFTATGYQNIQVVVTGLTTTNNDYPRMDINATSATTSLAGVQTSTAFTGTDLYMLAGANESKNTSANNSWVVNIYDVNSTSTFKPVDSRSGGQDFGSTYRPVNQAGQFMSNSAISSVRVTTINGGNSFTGGTIKVYGVK